LEPIVRWGWRLLPHLETKDDTRTRKAKEKITRRRRVR
jgi:hypothetical protein